MSTTTQADTPDHWLLRLFRIERNEAGGVLPALLMFFLLFSGYFMLRPVRETMGITGGVRNLPWMFTATFIATLACMPLFGWLAARVARRAILMWTYLFFASHLALFAVGFFWAPDNVWLARVFYVWLSVFNFITISVAWSLLADLFPLRDAKRLFGLMAAGASLGGLCGPLLGAVLVGEIGNSGLMFLSTAMLIGAFLASREVHHWRERHPLAADEVDSRRVALGGSPFAGATTVLRSRYLLGISAFVVLLSSANVFLYLEQARIVALNFPDPTDQTRIFSILDVVVQSLALITQVFFTGWIAQRLGLRVLLTLVPLVVAAGFVCFAVSPLFGVFVVVMVIRRAGEYAMVRPGREMLFTRVSAEAKYKAKNFIDTTVYRGADAVSAWVKTGVDLLGQHPAIAAIVGAVLAVVWAATGSSLARQAEVDRKPQLSG